MYAKSLIGPVPNFADVSLARRLRRLREWLAAHLQSCVNCGERALVVEERVSIGPKKSMVVVRCHGQRFLVASAGDAIGPVIELAGRKPLRRARQGTKP